MKVKLKDVCEVIVPMRDKPKYFVDKSIGTPWCRIEDIQGKYLYGTTSSQYVDDATIKKLRLKVFPEGTVICACTGASIGTYAITKTDLITNQTFAGLVCSNRIHNHYLYYFVKLYTKAFINNSVGCAQAYISRDTFENIEIDLPDIAEQKANVSILENIDELIVANNKIIETFEKLMREIYDYWFVQFDFPDKNGRPYKSSGGEMVCDEKLKREIPKGWRVQNLLKNDLCKDIKPGIDEFDGIKTYYATADVINGEMGVGAQIDYDNRESRANMQPKPNSVWFAKMKNSIKHITVVPTSDDLLEKSVFSTGFFGLKCEPETLPYIRNFIYSDYFEKVKDLNSNGATMEAISNDGVRNVKLLIPDEITLKKYSEVIGACLSQNDTLRKENAKLISLRDWLLPMLMNGQIKVSD